MLLTTTVLSDKKHLKVVSATSTYGIGFITLLVLSFYHLFGIECKMYDDKIAKAKESATAKLIEKATALNAAGIMDIHIQVWATTVFISGTAFE